MAMLKNEIAFDQALKYGFNFPGARGWYSEDNRAEMALDAALITSPNTTVPVELLAFIDPTVIEIATAPRRAKNIFDLQKKGDFATAYMKWRVEEIAGRTQPYSDFANNGVSDINVNWPVREQYRFETTIQYGDLEAEMASMARLDLAARKQRAATTVLEIDGNAFYLRGVAGREIYGILNDPNLPAAIPPLTGAGGLTWATKTATEIYNDVIAVFQRLAIQSAGYIENDSPIRLILSPGMEVLLARVNDLGKSAMSMVKDYFPNIEIVTLPELASATAGETMMMVAPSTLYGPTGFLGFSELIRAGRVVPELSAMKQKWISTTYGGVIMYPWAVASMQGI